MSWTMSVASRTRSRASSPLHRTFIAPSFQGHDRDAGSSLAKLPQLEFLDGGLILEPALQPLAQDPLPLAVDDPGAVHAPHHRVLEECLDRADGVVRLETPDVDLAWDLGDLD